MAASMAKIFSRVPLGLLSRNLSKCRNRSEGIRQLLSASYTDRDGWVRGQGYAKVDNMDVLYSELKGAFDMGERVGASRVDRFIDNIQESGHCDRAVDLLRYLRQSSENHLLRSCTTHSFIRSCLNYNQENLILKVLLDKSNFGIFPDSYCSHLALDKFMENEKLQEAVSFSVELMQMDEIHGNRLTELLTLNCCHNYLKTSPTSDSEGVDDMVERIGKTLVDCCSTQNTTLHHNYLLIGLCLSEQFRQLFKLMESIISTSKHQISDEIPALFQQSLSRWKLRAEIRSAGPSEEPIDPFNPPKDPEEIFRRREAFFPTPTHIDDVTADNIRNPGSDADKPEEINIQFDNLWKQLESRGLVAEKLDLNQLMEEELGNNLEILENQELASHKQNVEEYRKQRYYMNMVHKKIDAALKGEIPVSDDDLISGEQIPVETRNLNH